MLKENVLKILNTISSTNYDYVHQNEESIKKFANSQNPVATLVMCCDSRAHTTSFTYNPENNYFLVRNIGNQYILNQGCVEFGVRVLETSLLIFLGHTQCGAIKASMGNYANLHSSIIREIDHLALSIKKSELVGNEDEKWANAVVNNVNQQVELAMKDFQDLVSLDKLIILGMVLDIDNHLQKGYGRITLLNLNGEMNQEKLKSDPRVASFFNI
jgi:carbonic anhydrase